MKKVLLCLKTWEYSGPGVIAGKIYFCNEENEAHYIVNGSGYFKGRFVVFPEGFEKKKLFRLCFNY